MTAPPRTDTSTSYVDELTGLPDAAKSLTTLGFTAGYADAFVVHGLGSVDSAAWAALMLDEASAPLRQLLPPGWRMLGLKHGPLSTDGYVLGWPIRTRGFDHLLVGAESLTGAPAELLWTRWDDGILFSTMIGFDNAVMRGVWAGIEPWHKRIVRLLLSQATVKWSARNLRGPAR